MSHSSNINLVQLTKEEIEALGDERRNASGFAARCIFVETKEAGIDTTKPGGDYSATKRTGWLVLQRLQHLNGKSFIAPTFCETKPEADLYASNFHNIVAIMPIEWEE